MPRVSRRSALFLEPGYAWFVVGTLVYAGLGALAGLAVDLARASKPAAPAG